MGNVRAVVGVGGISGATDYYPGGMVMPNRQLTGAEGYRYGYQGEYAETDSETQKPAFELRLYDPRINRWLTPDPKGQYHSPYLSMGNSWVSQIDPDGAEADDWYKNAQGEIVWFDNTSESFTNDQGEWTNVGATLTDVADYLGLPSGSFEFSNTEWILLGARSGRGFMGLPAPVSLETSGHLTTSFTLSNAGEYGSDRIDGQTAITGINFNTDLSVSTFAPGVGLMGISGKTSLFERWTPTGKLPQFTSPLNTTNRTIVYRSGQSVITGSSLLSISLNAYYRKSRGFSRTPTFDLGVHGDIPIKLQQNGQRKLLDINGHINF